MTTTYEYDGSNVIAGFDGNNTLLTPYITPGRDANLSMAKHSEPFAGEPLVLRSEALLRRVVPAAPLRGMGRLSVHWSAYIRRYFTTTYRHRAKKVKNVVVFRVLGLTSI